MNTNFCAYVLGHGSGDDSSEDLVDLDSSEDLRASTQKRFLETLGPLSLLKDSLLLPDGVKRHGRVTQRQETQPSAASPPTSEERKFVPT